MQTIWKYELKIIDDVQEFDIPLDAEIVKVATQGVYMSMWVRILNPDARFTRRRRFLVSGTGYSVGDDWYYVGTAFDGPYVWHLWEWGI
jgi:hypothetical protein